jgi:Helix-turn-helix domain
MSPGRLAEMADISLRQLERYFAKDFTATPKAWLREQRMQSACNLLSDAHSVKDGAYTLCFRHPSHFCREFKRKPSWNGVLSDLCAAGLRAGRLKPQNSDFDRTANNFRETLKLSASNAFVIGEPDSISRKGNMRRYRVAISYPTMLDLVNKHKLNVLDPRVERCLRILHVLVETHVGSRSCTSERHENAASLHASEARQSRIGAFSVFWRDRRSLWGTRDVLVGPAMSRGRRFRPRHKAGQPATTDNENSGH